MGEGFAGLHEKTGEGGTRPHLSFAHFGPGVLATSEQFAKWRTYLSER
jgi:hypothetical protein